MLVIGTCILQQEHFMVQDVLPVHIFHNYVKELDISMDLDVVFEVGHKAELHPQCGSRDGLYVR